MKEKIQYYTWYLKAFLLEKEEYSEALYSEYENQIFKLQPRDNGWGLNQKQIRATIYLQSCLTKRRLALKGHPQYIEDAHAMAGIRCLMDTTKEQGIYDEVLLEVQRSLMKEEALYLNPEAH